MLLLSLLLSLLLLLLLPQSLHQHLLPFCESFQSLKTNSNNSPFLFHFLLAPVHSVETMPRSSRTPDRFVLLPHLIACCVFFFNVPCFFQQKSGRRKPTPPQKHAPPHKCVLFSLPHSHTPAFLSQSPSFADLPERAEKPPKKEPAAEAAPAKKSKHPEPPKTPFDAMCADVRAQTRTDAFKEAFGGNPALVRCCLCLTSFSSPQPTTSPSPFPSPSSGRVAISRFERQLFYEWTSMTTGRADQVVVGLHQQEQQQHRDAAAAEAAATAECEAKLKSIAVETAAAEAAVARLRAELAAWQRVLDRHNMALPGLEAVRTASQGVRVEDARAVDEFVLPLPHIDGASSAISSASAISDPSTVHVPSIVPPLRAVVTAVCILFRCFFLSFFTLLLC